MTVGIADFNRPDCFRCTTVFGNRLVYYFYTVVSTENVYICSLSIFEYDSVDSGQKVNRSHCSQNSVSGILEFREQFLEVPGILL
jgi:hypothetical protein